MKFDWKNLGFVFVPDNTNEQLFSHTTPVSPILLDKCLRVYYSPRTRPDAQGNSVSFISFVDLDPSDPTKVMGISQRPLLELGSSGSFDEHGTMVAEVLKIDGRIFMYYMGWQRTGIEKEPYKVKLGLAISDDDGNSFRRCSSSPVLSVDDIDPISIGNVTVLVENDLWRMWYTSYSRWEFGGIKPTPEYVVKFAESSDGINWNKTGFVCLPEDEEGGIATPSIFKLNDRDYHIWYGYRKPYEEDGSVGKYKIGYAISEDGINWNKRHSDFNLGPSGQQWDSQMMCYPAIIETNTKIYLFYCGNDFGRGGFGVAYAENYEKREY